MANCDIHTLVDIPLGTICPQCHMEQYEELEELRQKYDEEETQRFGAMYTSELYERILIEATRHLDHYPPACGCNGILILDQHLAHIMAERLELIRHNGELTNQKHIYRTQIEQIHTSTVKLLESNAAIGKLIHWPDCWDTSVFPTLQDAMEEHFGAPGHGFKCNGYECTTDLSPDFPLEPGKENSL